MMWCWPAVKMSIGCAIVCCMLWRMKFPASNVDSLSLCVCVCFGSRFAKQSKETQKCYFLSFYLYLFFISFKSNSQRPAMDIICLVAGHPIGQMRNIQKRQQQNAKEYIYIMRICTFGIYMFSSDCIKSFQLQDDMCCLAEEIAMLYVYFRRNCATFQSHKLLFHTVTWYYTETVDLVFR